MTTNFIEMTLDEWVETYKPINNHIDNNSSFGGIMFETYGDEVEFVKFQHPANIWTYGDGDGGGGYIWSGWMFVNRIGYFVTEVPCPDDTTIQILIDEPPIECEKCEVFIYNYEEDDHECE
jgi:hypothetical protein